MRRSEIVARFVIAIASTSNASATAWPWKLPPLISVPSSNTSGLSVAAFSSRDTSPSANCIASSTGPCTCGMQRSA